MKTKTVRLHSTTPSMVVEVNRQEANGWAVRLILRDSKEFIIVFERNN